MELFLSHGWRFQNQTLCFKGISCPGKWITFDDNFKHANYALKYSMKFFPEKMSFTKMTVIKWEWVLVPIFEGIPTQRRYNWQILTWLNVMITGWRRGGGRRGGLFVPQAASPSYDLYTTTVRLINSFWSKAVVL